MVVEHQLRVYQSGQKKWKKLNEKGWLNLMKLTKKLLRKTKNQNFVSFCEIDFTEKFPMKTIFFPWNQFHEIFKNKKSKLCLILWYIPKTYFVHKFWNKKLLILLKKVEKITSYFLRITNLWNNYFTKTLENIIKYVCMMHHYDFRTILIKK